MLENYIYYITSILLPDSNKVAVGIINFYIYCVSVTGHLCLAGFSLLKNEHTY